jgi:hypothetical protein
VGGAVTIGYDGSGRDFIRPIDLRRMDPKQFDICLHQVAYGLFVLVTCPNSMTHSIVLII